MSRDDTKTMDPAKFKFKQRLMAGFLGLIGLLVIGCSTTSYLKNCKRTSIFIASIGSALFAAGIIELTISISTIEENTENLIKHLYEPYSLEKFDKNRLEKLEKNIFSILSKKHFARDEDDHFLNTLHCQYSGKMSSKKGLIPQRKCPLHVTIRTISRLG
jgi:hypothetical protein